MSNLQKWFLIGAVCLIAVSLFMISQQRYMPLRETPVVIDKWTGKFIVGP